MELVRKCSTARTSPYHRQSEIFVFDIMFMKSSIQSKGAITLTFASVLLLSGLWALWHTPTTTYEPRKNEQVAGFELVVKPNNSSVQTFKVREQVEEITINAWPQIIPSAPYDPVQPPPEITPVISLTVYDPKGEVIRVYDNVTSVPQAERIAVFSSGDFKLLLTNNVDSAMKTEIRINDVTKVPNHPFEAMGQWLAIVSAPVFGLAVWFIARSRHRPADSS